jgi:hypothetical protein
MKTSSAKDKGKRLQKLIAGWIADLTGLTLGPDEEIESRQMGQAGCDIRLGPTARKLFPFSIECKNTENWSVPSAIKQAQANMYPGTNWLVILSKNRSKPVVILDAEVFFQILKQKRMRTKV